MASDVMMYILQGALGIIMLFFGFILNGLRSSLDEVNTDLKSLNNAVLGQYMTRDDSDARWKAQRDLDHELRGMITSAMIDIAKVAGKPYDFGVSEKIK